MNDQLVLAQESASQQLAQLQGLHQRLAEDNKRLQADRDELAARSGQLVQQNSTMHEHLVEVQEESRLAEQTASLRQVGRHGQSYWSVGVDELSIWVFEETCK